MFRVFWLIATLVCAIPYGELNGGSRYCCCRSYCSRKIRWSICKNTRRRFGCARYQEFIAAREARKAKEIAQRQREQELAKAKSALAGKNGGAATKKHGLNPYQLEKRIKELEGLIHQLESRLEEITAAIGTASAEGDAQSVRSLGEAYNLAEADLYATMAEWFLKYLKAG